MCENLVGFSEGRGVLKNSFGPKLAHSPLPVVLHSPLCAVTAPSETCPLIIKASHIHYILAEPLTHHTQEPGWTESSQLWYPPTSLDCSPCVVHSALQSLHLPPTAIRRVAGRECRPHGIKIKQMRWHWVVVEIKLFSSTYNVFNMIFLSSCRSGIM